MTTFAQSIRLQLENYVHELQRFLVNILNRIMILIVPTFLF